MSDDAARIAACITDAWNRTNQMAELPALLRRSGPGIRAFFAAAAGCEPPTDETWDAVIDSIVIAEAATR